MSICRIVARVHAFYFVDTVVYACQNVLAVWTSAAILESLSGYRISAGYVLPDLNLIV